MIEAELVIAQGQFLDRAFTGGADVERQLEVAYAWRKKMVRRYVGGALRELRAGAR